MSHSGQFELRVCRIRGWIRNGIYRGKTPNKADTLARIKRNWPWLDEVAVYRIYTATGLTLT